LGAPRTPEQIAYEDMMRRQSWESGQIDFAGRDSFANIWARIEQTISTNPTVEEAAPAAPAPAPIVPVMQKTPEGN
jgi:glycogenin